MSTQPPGSGATPPPNVGGPPPGQPPRYGATPPPSFGGPPPSQPGGAAPQDQAKGFIAALFDFKFDHFVTPKIVKAVYLVMTVLILLGALITFIVALSTGEGIMILFALFVVPIMAIIYLALARMSMEMYYAVIRMSEDVHHRLPRA